MKKTIKVTLVALLVAIIGLVGILICLIPGQTKADKTIVNYVSAINSGKTEKMSKYTYSASDLASDFLGDGYAGLIGALEEHSDVESAEHSDELYQTLATSVFSANYKLPSDFTKVKAVKLVGCIDGEETTELGMTRLSVKVVLKIDYVDAEGENQTTYSVESIKLIKIENKYYIVG